jgi:hypothetical protein
MSLCAQRGNGIGDSEAVSIDSVRVPTSRFSPFGEGNGTKGERAVSGNVDRLVDELESLWRSVSRGRPFGATAWQKRTAKMLDLEYTFRKQGRPRKVAKK